MQIAVRWKFALCLLLFDNFHSLHRTKECETQPSTTYYTLMHDCITCAFTYKMHIISYRAFLLACPLEGHL